MTQTKLNISTKQFKKSLITAKLQMNLANFQTTILCAKMLSPTTVSAQSFDFNKFSKKFILQFKDVSLKFPAKILVNSNPNLLKTSDVVIIRHGSLLLKCLKNLKLYNNFLSTHVVMVLNAMFLRVPFFFQLVQKVSKNV